MFCLEFFQVISFDDLKNGDTTSIHKPIFCESHPSENLKHYCTTCQVSIFIYSVLYSPFIIPRRSEGYSFGAFRPLFWSIRCNRNHISVPIGQIWFILGIND